jgi:hypothetical protein
MTEADEIICRLELLSGHLYDQLAPTRELVASLRLQANASVTTRSKLDSLYSMSGLLWEEMGRIREEIETIRNSTKDRTEDAT